MTINGTSIAPFVVLSFEDYYNQPARKRIIDEEVINIFEGKQAKIVLHGLVSDWSDLETLLKADLIQTYVIHGNTFDAVITGEVKTEISREKMTVSFTVEKV